MSNPIALPVGKIVAMFGPNWEPIVALVRRAATLTPEETKQLDAARYAARSAAGDVARDAAGALVVADLIGEHGFTQDHFDTLTAPWFHVCGDPRAEVTA